MSLESFLIKIAQVTRLVQIPGTKKESYQAVTSIPCMIQPMRAEETSIVGGVFGKTFRMFCKLNADVKDTDKLTIGGEDYLVRGISDYDYGLNPHKEIVLQSVTE